LLKKYISDNYAVFSGKTLEKYFHSKMMQTGHFTQIGNWWNKKGEDELDMVAINEFDKICLIAEVKRNPEKLNPNELSRKIQSLPHPFNNYHVDTALLSMENM